MGRLAAIRIRELVSSNPAQDFAFTLLEIVDELVEARRKVRDRIRVSDPKRLI
jgi:hypothetical protein